MIIPKEKVNQVKRFIVEKKPVIISGPTGCGKTTLAQNIAYEMGYDILEINASDDRNKKNIEEILGPAAHEGSLLAPGRLILIDDVEALSGTEDRGGIQVIVSLVQQTKWPIIFTTIEPSSPKLNLLRKKTALVELEPPSNTKIFSYLADILDKEHVIYDPKVLEKLVIKSKGDIRAAITDLEASIKNGVLDSINEIGEREKKESIQTALSVIFKGKEPKRIVNSLFNAGIDLDEAVLWLDENIPTEFTKKDEIYKAYAILSKADIFNQRIRKRQHWRFLVYRNFLMTLGINSVRQSCNEFNVSYKRSMRPLKYFWAHQKNIKRKIITQKLAEKTHTSQTKASKEILPFIRLIYKNGGEIENLELTAEEREWLIKS